MKFSFSKNLSSPLINQIKSEEVEYIFAKKLGADQFILKYMRNRIILMKGRLKEQNSFHRGRVTVSRNDSGRGRLIIEPNRLP
jgi:uncharacterized beta-barrel protein YwiB (DUF1934 family)